MNRTLVIASLLLFAGLPVGAQNAFSPAVKRLDLALGYTAIYANAPPPGKCGCFWMNGGSAQLATANPAGLGLAFDVGVTTASHVGGGAGHDITLATYLAGPRYAFWNQPRLHPYVQALVGAAHAYTNYAGDDGSTTFAFAAATGVDYKLSRRFAWRVLEAGYLFTQVPNGADNQQNQLRLSTALVLRLK